MNDTTPETSQPPVLVVIEWQDPEAGHISLTCRFALNSIRHVVERHVRNRGEAWGRVLSRGLIDRLIAAANRGEGWAPAAVDFTDFAEALGAEMRTSASRPLLCEFVEQPKAMLVKGRRRVTPGAITQAKILFVLRSGGVCFVRVDDRQDAQVTDLKGRLLTAYFPRCRGWVEPRRSYAAVVRRFVATWARHLDRCGKPRLPAAQVRVRAENEGRVVERNNFRFITPETWGFRPIPGGIFVFSNVPAWK